MLTLYLVRHARAMAIASSDKERELTQQGRDDAAKIGGLFKAGLIQPDHILCSPTKRTIATLEIMAEQGLHAPSYHIEEGLYNASPSFVLEAIKSTRATCLLVMGHNPALAIMLNRLAPADDVAPDVMHFPTATMAHITFDVQSYDKISEDGKGILHTLIRGSDC